MLAQESREPRGDRYRAPTSFGLWVRTISQVNKSIKVAKAIFTYAFDSEYVRSNIMHRYPRLQRVEGEPKANRGVFSELELQAIFATATPFVLGLFGTLSISSTLAAASRGVRPRSAPE